MQRMSILILVIVIALLGGSGMWLVYNMEQKHRAQRAQCESQPNRTFIVDRNHNGYCVLTAQ